MPRYLTALFFLTAFATPFPASWNLIKPVLFAVSLAFLTVLLVKSGQLWRPYRPSAMFAVGACAVISVAAARGYFPDDRSIGYLLATTAAICLSPFMRASSSADTRALVRALNRLVAIWLVLLIFTHIVDRSVFGEMRYSTSTPSEWYQTYSFIFGLSGVLCFAKAQHISHLRQPIVYSLGVVCLLMSLYMGGRGESIFAIFVCMVVSRKWVFASLLLAGSGLVTFSLTVQRYLLGLPALQRVIASLEVNDYGMRDVLFARGVHLLTNLDVAVFGGGANLFQRIFYYGEFGYYPHNAVLEAGITFGVIVGAYYTWVFYQHVVRFVIYCICGLEENDVRTLSAVVAYLGLLALKSGSVWNAWLLYFLVLVHPRTTLGLGAGRRSATQASESPTRNSL